MIRRVLIGTAALLFPLTAFAADPVAPGPAWKFDEVSLKTGVRYKGLILAETDAGIRFQVVRRLPGRPTITLTTSFTRKEIADVRRLAADDRAALREKLAELDPTGDGERRRMEALDLTPADWLGKPHAARRYDSEQFVLVSVAPDEVTRRAAVRLEQIYAAFARVLPPRRQGDRPTTVKLAGTLDDYRRLLERTTGNHLLNPAAYLPGPNEVVCGSDLARLGQQLAATTREHAEQLAALKKYEAQVRGLYKGAELERFEEQVKAQRQLVFAAEARNTATFNKETRRLFALLYHEAFHAYAATFVYPPLPAEEVRAAKGTGELPRWVNEGLAQIFESAVVEAGELRVEVPDPDRLGKVQDLLRGKGSPPGLVPTADLLRSGKAAFLAAHAGQQAAADRAYLSAWALTYYLAFERRLVGTAEFEVYLRAVNGGSDPVAAFREWVGQDLPAFEKDWHDYLLRLQTNGTLSPPATPRKP